MAEAKRKTGNSGQENLQDEWVAIGRQDQFL